MWGQWGFIGYDCPTCKVYLSKLHNVFVQIIKCICPMMTVGKSLRGCMGDGEGVGPAGIYWV